MVSPSILQILYVRTGIKHVDIATGVTKQRYKTSIWKYSSWSACRAEQIKYPETMTCLFKCIRCTTDVKYLTKQRRKKRSGTRRHHLLEWCNAITSERSRTWTIHSSFLKHNDRITKYKRCYMPVIGCTKTEKLPFSLRHDTIIQCVVTLTYEDNQLANFLPLIRQRSVNEIFQHTQFAPL